MKDFVKKLFVVFLVFICSFVLLSCDDNKEKEEKPYKADLDTSYIYDAQDFSYDVTSLVVSEDEARLPDLSGMNRAQIKYILDKLELTYEFKFDYTIINNDNELNKFTRYSDPLKAGDVVSTSKFFYVYTTVLELKHKVSDKLSLDPKDYSGKSFINDGIGVVTLIRAIDGDTAWFRDSVTQEEFKVRFLCINTTESTMKHDPWGKAASKFSSDILNNAYIIVIESEPNNKMDVYGRYLGYVWVNDELLNLKLVEEAYSPAGSANSKYKEYFTEAMLHAQITGRRYYGEIDPNYDYEIGDYK